MKTQISVLGISMLLIAGLSSGAAAQSSSSAADRPPTYEQAKRSCDLVFKEAQRLPAPTPRSVYKYGSRVVNQGRECLTNGYRYITNTGKAQSGQ
jgi:hypothetical protein